MEYYNTHTIYRIYEIRGVQHIAYISPDDQLYTRSSIFARFTLNLDVTNQNCAAELLYHKHTHDDVDAARRKDTPSVGTRPSRRATRRALSLPLSVSRATFNAC